MANGTGIYLLYYRIPEESGMPNPSPILRRFAFRVDGSVWVINEVDLPYRLFKRFDIHGVTWNCWKFDFGEYEKLVNAARESLQNEVQAMFRRAGVTTRKEQRKLENTNKPLADRIKAHKARCISRSKGMRKAIKDLKHAAERFGVPADQIGYGDAMAQVRGFQATMQERARVFLEACGEIESNLGRNDGMLQAAKAGGLWVPILADYMEDKDINPRLVGKLRNLFD